MRRLTMVHDKHAPKISIAKGGTWRSRYRWFALTLTMMAIAQRSNLEPPVTSLNCNRGDNDRRWPTKVNNNGKQIKN